MGKGRNQRILPLLVAANTVNYGKPFKMNTAEAIAGCLYITGFKEAAESLMSPFSYGPEFLRLNHEALEAYSACSSAEEVLAVQEGFVRASEQWQRERDLGKQERERNLASSNGMGGYMDDMDLPPTYSDDEYEEYEDGQGEKEEEEDGVEGGSKPLEQLNSFGEIHQDGSASDAMPSDPPPAPIDGANNESVVLPSKA
jgi:pre-rRNA-processing protein TSR3